MADKKFEAIDGLLVGNDSIFDGKLTVAGNTVFSSQINCISIHASGTIQANVFIGSGADLTDIAADSANTLDGLPPSAFLRSNVSDSYSSGVLTITSNGSVIFDGSNLTVKPSSVVRFWNDVAVKFGTADSPGVTIKLDASSNSMTIRGASANSLGSNVNFANSTLFVDTTNRRIGVGTVFPSSDLEVDGDASITGFLSVDGLYVSNNLTIGVYRALTLEDYNEDGGILYNTMMTIANVVSVGTATGTTSVYENVLPTPRGGVIYYATPTFGNTRTFSFETGQPVGSQASFIRNGAGTVTFIGNTGVTVISSQGSTPVIATDKTAATAVCVASNVWFVFGDLGA